MSKKNNEIIVSFVKKKKKNPQETLRVLKF